MGIVGIGWATLIAALATVTLGVLPGGTLAAGDDVRAISLGVAHRCVVKTDGTVWCWGVNNKHQIGDGTEDFRTNPVRVELSGGGFLGGVKAIARSSGDHTCAAKLNGTVRCWGQNDNGELGDGTTDPRLNPVTTIVNGSGVVLGDVKALALGDDHACARRSNGTVWCWGFNVDGRLGDGTTEARDAAVRVRQGAGFLTGVTAIAAGTFHTCALMADSTVRCWGANGKGQLGDGTTDERHAPVRVRTAAGTVLRHVTGIAAGYQHTCALMSDRTVRCWGENADGQLGDGTDEERHHPVRVRRGSGFLADVRSHAAGGANTCASTTAGTAFCWGDNEDASIGDGTDQDSHRARRVLRDSGPLTGVRRVATNGGHSCALRNDATVWCWGANHGGGLGTGNPENPLRFAERVDFP